MSRGSSSSESPKVPAANPASLEFVAAGTWPVCFEAQESRIAIRQQCGNLLFPAHGTRSEWSPDGFVPLHVAVFRMDVDDPRLRQHAISIRKRVFTRDKRIRRIPNKS